MNDPYAVLGVSSNATDEEIKEAYRQLARKYQAGNYSASPLSDIAKQKMEELDRAYDAVMLSRRGQAGQGGYQSSGYRTAYTGRNAHTGNAYDYSNSQFPDIRANINCGRIDDAETVLDGIPVEMRNAEWYFLKGQIQQRRGWFDEAYKNHSKACQMEPQNAEYTTAFQALNNSGGYRASRSRNSGCSGCDICSGLLCADCCCECMGGDLIPGC